MSTEDSKQVGGVLPRLVAALTSIARYKLALLKPCTKALSQSTKVSLRVDHRGFLSLQCMIVPENKQVCFVEFLVCVGVAHKHSHSHPHPPTHPHTHPHTHTHTHTVCS